MKYEGIIIKLTKNKVIVTTDDFQCFYIRRSTTAYIGKQIQFTENEIIKRLPVQAKLFLSAACILLVITCFINFTGLINIRNIFYGPQVFAYVDVDINPSVEMEIDGTGKVLNLIPLNEDAKFLVKKFNFGKVDVSDAINKIIDEVKENKSVNGTQREYILVSSTLNNKKSEIGKEYQSEKKKLDVIMNSLKDTVQEKGKVKVYLVKTNIHERENARNEGISTGRYLLYNEYKSKAGSFSIEEAKRVNVNELLKGVLGYKAEEDGVDVTPGPTPSPFATENATVTPTGKYIATDSANTLTPSQTPKSTIKPTTKPTPKLSSNLISKPILKPTQKSTPKSTPKPTPSSKSSSSKYMKFEAYSYPGQFIQHKIHFEAYISANGILPDDCTFKIVPGLADPDCISFESKNFPGFYLKNENFKIVLKPYDGSADFKESVTFRKVSGLADKNLISFQSYNYPDRYIRNKNFILQIDEIVTDTDKKDATFIGIEVK